MPPKDDDDPASTKEVVTKRQKQLLNREELDLNLIAESLGCYIIEAPLSSLTTDDPEGLARKIKKSVPKVEAKPSPRDFPGYDPAAEADALADIEADMRRGRVDPPTQSPRPQGPSGASSSMGARIRAALRDFRKSLRGNSRGSRGNVLGAIATTGGLQYILQNLQTFDPNYKATEDPTSPLYQPPEPSKTQQQVDKDNKRYGRTFPSGSFTRTIPKPVEIPVKPYVKPKPSPEPEPEVDPSQDPTKTPKTTPPVVTPKNPDGDKKKPPVTVNPPTGVGADNKTRSNQSSTTLPQGQLSQIAQGTATAQALKSATSKTGKGKLPRIGVPGYRGKIGRRSNPQ
jgi:hypothetical protein